MTSIKTEFTPLLRFTSKTWCGIACLAAVIVGWGPAKADLVSPYGGETAPNFAELSVETDHVRVMLEIDLSAYPFFVAADDGSGASLSERTGQTFHVSADGDPLDRVVHAIDVRPRIPRQTAASSLVAPRPRSAEVVFVDLEFPFQGRPEKITFTPPLNSDGVPLASIGVMAEHSGVPVTDYRFLSQSETILLSWDDPWFTRFENPNLTRHHKSPLMSFLSIAPREVRHEVIFRLKDLEGWTELKLGDAESLTADQVTWIKEEASDFFKTQNPVTVDGVNVMPSSVKVSRIAVGAEGLRVLPDQAPAERTTMLLGAVLSYPQDRLASQVDMHWQLFPDGVDIVPITLSDPAGGVPSQIYKTDPKVRWTNHLTAWEEPRTQPVIVKTAGAVPLPFFAFGLAVISVICLLSAWNLKSAPRGLSFGLAVFFAAAAILTFAMKGSFPRPEPDEIATHHVAKGMLDNINTALLETDADGIQAALAPFVDESHREDVSAELRRGLSVTLPSGASALAEEIEDLLVENLAQGQGKDDFQIIANWTARVSGGHWGHLHRQNVNFRGLMDVSRRGDQWMLDGLTVLTAKKEG
ncbi:hypothetical protein [Ruegeria sp. SCP11]|uniref:hypothetical protein n=1 Tax=Ruegeria sp. SCP11 TaxID=3141378 RepID=UPI00333920B9